MATNESGSSLMIVEKLKGRENYSEWRFQMTALLKHDGLWQCVAGPSTEITDPAATLRREEKAHSKIVLALDKSVFPHVMQANTAKEAWTALQKAFEDTGLHHRLHLLRKLCSVKLSNYTTMEEYVNAIMGLSQQLASIGKPIDDEFLGVIMLQGLADDYQPMVMALESSGMEISSDFVKAKLLQDNKWQNGKHTSGDTALLVKKNKSSPWCWSCKQKGHYKNQCTQRKDPRREQSSSGFMKNKNKPKYKDDKSLIAALGINMQCNGWYIDSGATSHMTGHNELLSNMSNYTYGQEVTMANNSKLCVSGVGSARVTLEPDGAEKTISDVKYVPNLSVNLLSVSSLVSKGYCVTFNSDGCKILDSDDCYVNGKLIATASNVEGLFKLDTLTEHANVITVNNDQMLWHRRLGHLNHYAMKLLKGGLVAGINYNEDITEKCVSCIKGKHCKKPFFYNKSKELAENRLDLVHSDLMGPMEVESWSGARYLFTLIDDHSRKVFCYFLRSKDEVADVFQEFCVYVETQAERKIKVLRTDNGGEYCNRKLNSFLKSRGIKHEFTVPYCPQQNGVAERYNRTIIEKVRTMLADAKCSKQMWAEAANTAVYLINRSPAKKIRGEVPEKRWTGNEVNLGYLKIFGCQAYVHVPDALRKKLDEKSKQYIFTGYSETSLAYRLIDPKTHKLRIARDVVFLEDRFGEGDNFQEPQAVSTESGISLSFPIEAEASSTETVVSENLSHPDSEVNVLLESSSNISEGKDNCGKSTVNSMESQDKEQEMITAVSPCGSSSDQYEVRDVPSDVSVQPTVSRYPKRTAHKPKFYDDYVMFNSFDFAMLAMSDSCEPMSLSEALSSHDKKKWQDAIKNELNSFKVNDTWVLVDKPSDKNVVKNKWVFKIKKNQNGNIVRYKARLVAKGFTQKYGLDYTDTFSPVIRFSNLRLLFAMSTELDLETQHLDVETAFLNGDIDEEIYMYQPEGFEESGAENKVCLLKKAIYGLKQSSRLWYEKANSVLLNLGYKQSKVEPCIFTKNSENLIVTVALYVDDFFIFYNDVNEANILKSELHTHFRIKELGPISYCLGMEITRDRSKNELKLSQEQYISKILSRFEMLDCKGVKTPLEQGKNFSMEGESYDAPYQQLIGSLMYLSVCTRPDISFAVSYLSQFNINHTKEHWTAAKRVLRYLKATKELGITYSKSEKPLTGFVDADWANDPADRKSYFGYIFTLSNAPISWESRKQKILALSSTEAEYIGITEATKESLYLKSLVSELYSCNKYCTFLNINQPICIYNDNQSAIKLAEYQVYHKRTKHIHIKYHFIREKVRDKEIILMYMPTTEMVSDMLTKPLGSTKHKFICDKLNLK